MRRFSPVPYCYQISFNPSHWRYGVCECVRIIGYYDNSLTLFHTNSPLHMHYQPSVCLLDPVQQVRNLFVSSRFCWKHSSAETTELAMILAFTQGGCTPYLEPAAGYSICSPQMFKTYQVFCGMGVSVFMPIMSMPVVESIRHIRSPSFRDISM